MLKALAKVPAGGGARAGAVALLLLLLLTSSVLFAACGDSSSTPKNVADLTGAAYPNVDPANTRHAGGPIDSSTVSKLQVAWSRPLDTSSTAAKLSFSPAVGNGAIYIQDPQSNVLAIDLENGELLWKKRYGMRAIQGPNGVVVAAGRVYGATPTSAFALDQKTGKQLWSVPLTRNESETIDMAPGYEGGRVYVSTAPLNEPSGAGGVGILWALDAKTGKKLWHFDTVPKNLWGNARVNSGGGLSQPPAFDGRGSMYIGVGSPGPSPGNEEAPWGSSRPGPNLYTDSILKLNAKTGKVDWYYQLTPHDLYEWDLQGPPMLIKAGGRQLVVAAGKAGIAIALDAKTGKLVWSRLLGKHNGHDNDGRRAMRGEYSKLKGQVLLDPGTEGGVTGAISSNGSTVFASVVNHRVVVSEGATVNEFSAYFDSELVALDAKTGAIAWKHRFPSPYYAAYGATTAVNDLVFATTVDGTVYALNAKTGEAAWEAELPSETDIGVTVAGDTLIAPATLIHEKVDTELVAYRLGG
jgi:outer membrane protein assembly factor BamB